LLLRPSDPPLAKIYVEPTTTCNLRCRICVRNSWSEPVGFMEMTTYRRLVDGLRKVPSLRTMAFWGFGEPLLHPDIVEMVALARELGAKTELITNGLLLDRTMAEGLVMAGLDTLVVSVDGTSAESRADIRSGADLRLVQENVKGLHTARRANRCGNPEIGLEFVVTRRNVSELPNLRRLAYSIEASFIVVTNVLPYTEEFKEEILYWLSTGSLYSPVRSKWFPEIMLPRMDARREYLEPLLRLLRQGGVIDPLPRRSDGAEGYCRFVGEGAVAVAWDGEVSPCVALMHSYTCYVLGREKMIRRYTLGNVGREEIARIWERDEFKQFRRRVLQFDFAPCVDCGGCQLAESNEEDCFGNAFPVCGDCLWARGIILCP
jgi:MoaA/NifB/PqqE/SkfB family radical SAM enzyme